MCIMCHIYPPMYILNGFIKKIHSYGILVAGE